MSTGQPRRGIVDPWRIVEPLKREPPAPPPLEEKARFDLSQHEDVNRMLDADLRVAQQCAIRARSGSILIRNKQIENGNDALRDLGRCLLKLTQNADWRKQLAELPFGVDVGGHMFNCPVNMSAAMLKTAEGYEPRTVLYFIRQTYDDGMLRLIKLLNAVARCPGPASAAVLKTWGIVPMMR